MSPYAQAVLEPPRVRPCDAPGGLETFSIGSIRAHLETKLAIQNDLRDGQFRFKIYPSGIMLEGTKGYQFTHPKGEVRGVISGFSNKAARRLREAFLTLWVPGYVLWALSLTTHAILTPEQWERAVKRFRMACKRAGWACLWRVELQKRKTPHLHVAGWLPPAVSLADVSAVWLRCIGESQDLASRQFAVVGEPITHDEAGWAVYLALHNGKHKEAQLGWNGKQWGKWNGSAFVERVADHVGELNRYEHWSLLRMLRKYDRSAREAQARREWEAEFAGPCDVVHIAVQAKDGTPCVAYGVRPNPAGKVVMIRAPFVRPKVKPVHRGNLLRCIEGSKVRRMIDGLLSGSLGMNQVPF